jgi:integrase
VPEVLRPRLIRLASGRAPDSHLFALSRTGKHGSHQAFYCAVQRVCRAAAVPIVCPHSLRGLHATLAIEEGASGEAVARALGHTSFEITVKHYATPDSVANARLEKASQSLALSPSSSDSARLDQLLAILTLEELAALRKRLAV